MGLIRTDYIIYGWKLPFNMKDQNGEFLDFWDDRFLPYIEGHSDAKYNIVRDENGRWMAFGKLIAVGSEWNFKELKFNNLNKDEAIEKYCEYLNTDGPNGDPFVFIFTNYR